MDQPHLRDAGLADLPAISDIYNHFVLTSTCTFQLESESLADRREWFDKHASAGLAVIVAESADRVVGWGSLSRFHARAGYAPTAEPSVYIHQDFHRRGLGRLLLDELVERARAAGFHTLVGATSSDQSASLGLQAALGFAPVGRLIEVGQKFGRRLDVVYTQKLL